jgi:hypothetical protein
METHLGALEAHFRATKAHFRAMEAHLEALEAHSEVLGGSPWISGCSNRALNQKELHGILIRQSWGYIPYVV